MSNCAEVTIRAFLDMQVCVPENWTDDQVIKFANQENPAGTDNGWSIRRAENRFMNGDPERNHCSKRDGFVHIMLEC